MSNLGNQEWPRPGLPPDDVSGTGRLDADLEWAPDDEEPWDLEPEDPADPGLPGPVPAGPGLPGPGRALFAQDGVADVMAPSPFLAALTEQAVGDVAGLSDAELVGVLRASQRQIAREQYKQALAAAEFGRRRRDAFQAALDRGVPAGCAAGGFPGEELAIELVITRAEAGHLIDDAIDLTSQLPRTLAAMGAGLIDAGRAGWIAFYTRSLSPADTARADEVLAAAAPELRDEQLARKADALEKKLNPDGARARRERAKRDGQRVEARREASGNASLAGRELDTADVLASKAHIDAIASRLREHGLPGSLDRLRALALTDLTQGRDPLDRITPAPAPAQPAGAPPASPSSSSSAPPSGPSPSGPSPVPALVNLIVPATTLLGFSAAPAQAGAWGLLDREETQIVTAAAAAHPRTRWCVTLTGPDGIALAHGCARGSRPRLLDDLEPHPPPAQLAELLRRLGLTLTPIATSSRDPAPAEHGYVPSRTLKHLVRARTATCDAPGCGNPAASADLDHTVAVRHEVAHNE